MLAAVALLVLVPSVAPLAGAASWAASPGDWPAFHRDAARAGATSAKGAFTDATADFRVKWSTPLDPAPWVSPVAADLDRDGIAEVVGTVGNASVDTSVQPPAVHLESGFVVLNGATGALKWKVGPNAGSLDFFSPTLGDVDGDGKAEVVWYDGNPLTGTFATNKVYAYKADGSKLWEWSDTNWGQKTPLPLNTLAVGSVDGEGARDEVVGVILLAKVDVAVQGQGLVVNFTQPEHRVIALNGEGGGGLSWQKVYANGTINAPALGDIDGDGVLDVAWGSGVEGGDLISSDELSVGLSEDFADDHVRALGGSGAPHELWSIEEPGFFPGESFAPTLADLDGDGKAEFFAGLNDPGPAHAADIVALDPDGTQRWRTRLQADIGAPIAAADVDGDGTPELVVQLDSGTAPDRNAVVALNADGTVKWRSPTLARAPISAPAVGDLTGDGKPEVAVLLSAPSNGNATLVVINGQTGALRMQKPLPGDGLDSLGGPVLADLDGDDDGRLEVVLNFGELGKPGKMMAFEPELPDLRVSELAGSAAEHALGVAENLSARVANVGSRAASGLVVEFRDGADTVGSATLDLAAGASQTVSVPWTPAHAGTRTMRVVADPAEVLPEWVETDNAQDRSLQVKAADLAFGSTDPGVSDANPGENATITVNATLRNLGDRDASDVVVRFSQDGATFAMQTVSVPAGSSRAVSAPMVAGSEGTHTLEVVADPDGAIPESNELNNRVSRSLAVRFIGPDLAFAAGDPTFSDPAPSTGDTITVGATLRNVGERDAPATIVRFLDDGATFAEFNVPALAVGGSQSLSAELLVAGEHAHRINVLADPEGAMREEHEDNNDASKLLQVQFQGPDLTLGAGDIAFSDPGPGDGDTLTVSATVRDAGNRSSPQAVVRFFDDGVAFGDAALQGLARNSAATVSVALLAQGVRDHTIRVVIDPDDALAEEQEANNEASKVLPVRFLAPDVTLAASDIAFDDRNPDEFDTLVAHVTVHNEGSPGRTARDVAVRLLDGGADVADATLASVPSGGSAVAELRYVIAGVGPRDLDVVLDPVDTVRELDETNNLAAVRVVVGKLDVTVTMAKPAFPIDEEASGVASVTFRSTHKPLASKEFTLPVEYVVPLPPGEEGAQALGAAAGVLAQVSTFAQDHVQLCVGGTCVGTTIDQAAGLAQLLGAGAAGGLAPELRITLFDLELRTNKQGQAAFIVPLSALGAVGALRAAGQGELCLSGPGADALNGALAAAGQAPVGCVRQAGSLPSLPRVANLPGTYRATAEVDWYGFPFVGRGDYACAADVPDLAPTVP